MKQHKDKKKSSAEAQHPDQSDLVDIVYHVATVVTRKERAGEFRDELIQELFVNMPTILSRYRPDMGDLSGYIYGYAVNILRVLRRNGMGLSSNEEYDLDDSISMIEAADEWNGMSIEDLVIDKIDCSKAIDHIKAVLAQKGLNEISFESERDTANRDAGDDKKAGERETAKATTPVATLLAKIGMPKRRVAIALGISPQLLNAYEKGVTKKVPRDIIDGLLHLAEENDRERGHG